MVAVIRPQVELRNMARGDLSAVHAIEKASYPFPWSRGIFVDCLRVGYRCHVISIDGAVCGYGILSAALDEAHLLNLCIHPARRRGGLARMMLDHLIDEVRILGIDRMFLEVRPSNKAAVSLYRRYDFHVIGRRPGYYPGAEGREDAVVMVRHFDPAND